MGRGHDCGVYKIGEMMHTKLPGTLRKKAQGKAIVNLSAKQINELADYIEKLHKQIKDEKCKYTSAVL